MTQAPRTPRIPILLCLGFFFSIAFIPEVHAQQVQVNAADPPTAEQGTLNLDVKVTGKGFKNGAQAKWFVTGTLNPGGVTVNSTTFVNANELRVNITVDDTAEIANFDIQVLNNDGRGGKGTELFRVTVKSANADAQNSCVVQPLPSGITLLGSLNYLTGGTPAYRHLGVSIRARQMILNGTPVVVVGVGTPDGTGKLEIFFLNPVTGQVLDGSIIGSGTTTQPHVTVNYAAGARSLAVGDVNADGIPDFVAGSTTSNISKAAVGSVTNGVVSYQHYQLPMPASATKSGFSVGWGVAMGDLNGNGSDVIAVGAIGGGRGSGVLGQVSLFTFNGLGFTNTQNVLSPLPNPKKDEAFGRSVAISDVAGSGAMDLIVGAPYSIVNGMTAAGRVFVFPGPVSSANYFSLNSSEKNNLGVKVAGGDVNGDLINDLLATTASSGRAYTGLVTAGQTPGFIVDPISGLATGWSTTEPDIYDVNADGQGDVVIGAPNAASGSVCGGAAYLYLSGSGFPLTTRLALHTPVVENTPSPFQAFGWAASFVPGTRLLLVTDHGLDLGSTESAGQVYIYKLN